MPGHPSCWLHDDRFPCSVSSRVLLEPAYNSYALLDICTDRIISYPAVIIPSISNQPFDMAVAEAQAGVDQCQGQLVQGKPQEELHGLLALPTHLLEPILSQTRNKKAIRLCCRHLRNTVDGMMYCAKLSLQFNYGDRVQEAFLKRMQQEPRLAIVRAYIKSEQKHLEGWQQPRLLDYMPRFATTLYLEGCVNDVTPLAALSNLTALSLYYRNPTHGRTPDGYGSEDECTRVWGLYQLQGLTSLQSNMKLNSVKLLAPTLKRLEVEHLWQAEHVGQLTNLEVLYCGSLHGNGLKSIKHLPLRHLGWDPKYDDSVQCDDADTWKHAPKTLTSIAVYGELAHFALGTMPTSITSLQLHDTSAAVIEHAGQAMPWIKHLSISLNLWKFYYACCQQRAAVWQRYQSQGCQFLQLDQLHLFVSNRFKSTVNDWDTLGRFLSRFVSSAETMPGITLCLHSSVKTIDSNRTYQPDSSIWV